MVPYGTYFWATFLQETVVRPEVTKLPHSLRPLGTARNIRKLKITKKLTPKDSGSCFFVCFCLIFGDHVPLFGTHWKPLKVGGLAATGPLVSRATPSPYGSAAKTLGTVPLTASECGSAQRRTNTDGDLIGISPKKGELTELTIEHVDFTKQMHLTIQNGNFTNKNGDLT